MAVNFTSIGAGMLKPAGARGTATAPVANGGFTEALQKSIGKMIEGVEESQSEANEAVTNMVNKTGEVHDAMIALQRAQMQLELTVTVRNKLVTAYQEIMRMPI